MLRRYETLLLARTETTEDDMSMIERQFDKVISDAKGKLSSFDKWGKFRLSFPVNKNTHGVYVLARYEVPAVGTADILQELDRFLKIKCNEIVMRHVTIKLKENAPATYQRPETIDMSRQGSLDTFLKDNKIENLLSSVDPVKGKGRGHDLDEDDINNDLD